MDARSGVYAWRTAWRRVALPALFLIAQPALSAGFQVSPVRAEIVAPDTVADFELRNPGGETVTVQIDAFGWQQQLHAEQVEPASGLMVVPRIARIAPGQSQRVRIALRGTQVAEEDAYRVHFREIPAAPPAGFVGVRTALKMDVPLFFRRSNAVVPKIDWRVVRTSDDDLALQARNQGARHFDFSHARITTPEGAVLAEDTGPHYVLAGAERQWPLTTRSRPERGAAVRLVIVSGGNEQRVEATAE